MREDEWIKAAMADDSIVVELLLRLNQSPPTAKKPAPLPPLDWGVRLPRSRQILRCSNIVQVKKEGESTRASPTTPLSWSGGTSVSGGGTGDSNEESSLPAKVPSGGGRSKLNGTGETTIRRSRKKKTFAELKEEEALQVKERIRLKKELATQRSALGEQKARNDNLKRIKLDLQLQFEKGTFRPSDALKEKSCDHLVAASVDHTLMILPTSVACHVPETVACGSIISDSCEVQKKDVVTRESSFALPDLNMPFEEDSGSEVLYGMS